MYTVFTDPVEILVLLVELDLGFAVGDHGFHGSVPVLFIEGDVMRPFRRDVGNLVAVEDDVAPDQRWIQPSYGRFHPACFRIGFHLWHQLPRLRVLFHEGLGVLPVFNRDALGPLLDVRLLFKGKPFFLQRFDLIERSPASVLETESVGSDGEHHIVDAVVFRILALQVGYKVAVRMAIMAAVPEKGLARTDVLYDTLCQGFPFFLDFLW